MTDPHPSASKRQRMEKENPEEERGLCQINRHISAPRVTERFRPGVGDEVTDPHPSSSKRQSMGNPEEERALCQIKRYHSTPGQAAAVEASEARGCAACRHVSAPSHAAAEWVAERAPEEEERGRQAKGAEEETTKAIGSSACRPGQAAEKEAGATTGRRQAKAAEKEADATPERSQANAEEKAARARQKKGISEARVRMSQANKNWDNLSKTAQARHFENDIRARVRSMIPGIGSVSENSLMLQGAARIKQLEVEVDSVASHLERLQEAQSSNGGKELDKSLEDQNVHEASLGEGFEPTTLDLRADGHKILRDVLPLPSKARGTRLLELASQYMSELTGEKNMKRKQVDEHCARTVVVQPVPEES